MRVPTIAGWWSLTGAESSMGHWWGDGRILTLHRVCAIVRVFESGGGSMAEKTSKKAASAAGKTLASDSASKAAKTAAGSALAQTKQGVTGKGAGSSASKTLASKGGTKASKSAAGSALTQRPAKRK